MNIEIKSEQVYISSNFNETQEPKNCPIFMLYKTFFGEEYVKEENIKMFKEFYDKNKEGDKCQTGDNS